MFEVGDYVMHGTCGVCRVESIGNMKSTVDAEERLYYTLGPINAKSSTIFSPVDNQKMIMRPIMSKAEALALIQEIKSIQPLEIVDEKRREEVYRQALKKYDTKEWVKIMKSSYKRKQARILEGKKVTACDEKYLQLAENHLIAELAIPLEIAPKEAEELIIRELINC